MLLMALRSDPTQTRTGRQNPEPSLTEDEATPELPPASEAEVFASFAPPAPGARSAALQPSHSPTRQLGGWPIPSTVSRDPAEARAAMQLPEFDELLLEKARVISGRFPFAEAEYRSRRGDEP